MAIEYLKRALESIESHFSVTRRVLVPVVLGVTVILVSLPFLAKAPATVAPVYAAALTVFLGLAVRPLLENAIAGLVISSSRMITSTGSLSVSLAAMIASSRHTPESLPALNETITR